MVQLSWTVIFQIINSLLLIGIIYLFYFLIIKLPKRNKIYDERINKIEHLVGDINKKIKN